MKDLPQGPGAGIALTGRPEQVFGNKVWVWLVHEKKTYNRPLRTW
jgi:hypothetical protein